MKRIIERPLWIALLAFAMSGVNHSPFSSRYLEEELEYLTRRGFTYRFVEENRIELTDPVSGSRTIKSLDEPSEAAINGWASSQGIPILEIDPRTIDTSLFSGMYTLWTSFPLAGNYKTPIVISDFNRDGRPDACGVSLSLVFPYEPSAQIFSIDSAGSAVAQHTYNPYPGVARWQGDVDNDMLTEVLFHLGGSIRNFEQSGGGSLPTRFNFLHILWEWGAAYSGIFVGSLDGDASTDFLYKGNGSDSISRVFVAEYRPDTNNFVRVWQYRFVLESGFAVGDFDNDSYVEFVVGDIFGRLFLVENTGDDEYAAVWQDSTSLVNLYHFTSGDLDMDGMTEFFAGATMSNGTWILVYEADSNDHYSPRFLFHLLSGSFGFEPTLFTTDLDNDGRLEFVVFAGSDLYIFKSSVNDGYYLWYYRRFLVGITVQAYNFFDLGHRKSLIVSRDSTDSLGRLHIYSEIYRPGRPLAVKEKEINSSPFTSLHAYPNPFNGRLTIEYALQSEQAITIRIYDILGKLVETVVDDNQPAGKRSLSWDAGGLSSGLYFVRLESRASSVISKVLLAK